jgi:hypothetical protein
LNTLNLLRKASLTSRHLLAEYPINNSKRKQRYNVTPNGAAFFVALKGGAAWIFTQCGI